VAAEPQISGILKRVGNREKILDYLRGSDAPEARKILEAADLLSKRERALLTVEAFCVAAKVPTRRAYGVIAEAVFEQSSNAATLIAAAAHPRVVERTVERALEKPQVVKLEGGGVKVIAAQDGFSDRKMLHQHAQFLPQPKGSTLIFGNQTIDNRDQRQLNVSALPPMEESVRRLSDRFNERLLTEGPKQIAAPVDVMSVDTDEDEDDEN
jgi:hypothetical protein